MSVEDKHCNIVDFCKDCIRYRKLQTVKCINCGAESVKVILDGPSMIGKCISCGNSFVGASFFAPCEIDFTEYVLKIEGKNLSNDQIILLKRLIPISALELKRFMQNNESFTRKFRLNEIIIITKALNDLNISYIIEPKLQYSKIDSCKMKEI